MKKTFLIVVAIILFIASFSQTAEARARYGSFRVGGYTTNGKGSHYYGGYVRSTHTPKYYLKH